MELTTQHWEYRYGHPVSTGIFKFQADDFQVTEDLGYQPSGEGEHQFIFVEKENTNTAYLAEQIARHTGLPLRQVTYAGRKDKYAVTRQWFGLHAPGQDDFDFSGFNLEGVRVLRHTRHHKKLKTGQLKGNAFQIQLRQVINPEAVEEKLQQISTQGVPNYYGEQRFGVMRMNDQGEVMRGGNLVLAERMIAGETIRHRNKRSMALSALRSWLFNEVISHRIATNTFDTVLPGDAVMLQGSNSFFVNDGTDSELQARYEEADLSPTAPLWGDGELPSQSQARTMESNLASTYSHVSDFLQTTGFEQERRPIKIWPQQLEWVTKGDTLTLSFSLPSGCFATSVLRECIETVNPINSV
ncbi:tRNA pseudouridine(13) synthase TruD [Alteromonas sp. ASW11-19]|uniref:tRNA pseudouridine synthase D n=1 Tax=Alteromonas salexigens TaxID=2982530 RepID=A0ABT2VJP5_9ALTE|nr:tRNA pseudouridine(13) synthase TruD [Alteromonas salexigens]MCU7552992.1 tRNA pseudouridine(13) synthase TruD [Alteromonas salexigens]